MQSGEYIADRWMVGIIKDICKVRLINVASFSDDWLLRLQKGESIKFVLGYKFGLNNAAAASIAQDKVATYELLRASDVDAVPHFLARTKVAAEPAWKSQVGGDFVVKPLVGTSGHGVRRFSDIAAADEWMRRSGIEAWAVSPYAKIKNESRVIILDDRVMIAYRKKPVEINGLRMFNLGKGATAQNIDLSMELVTLAQNAKQALGLRLAAIDIIEHEDERLQVLEINEGIMMENYMRQSPENKQRAYDVYDAIVQKMMK